ncbi:hypothetical protein Tco_0142488, partial [Tanacetum coccineum]
PSLSVRPPILPPRGAAVARPALHVVIRGGTIYTRENMGNVRPNHLVLYNLGSDTNLSHPDIGGNIGLSEVPTRTLQIVSTNTTKYPRRSPY